MAEIKYEIVKHIATISEGSWNKELNVISWNGREAKYDLRLWTPDRTKMGKGITLTAEELSKLRTIIGDIGL